MSKFCGKCGTQLNENGLCPKCDAAQIERMNELKQTYTVTDSSDAQPPAKKKKSGKKAVKVIAIVLVVVIVLGAAAGALSYFNVVDIPVVSSLVASVTGQTLDTSKKSFIINHDGSEYYISGACVVKLNDDGTITPVKYIDTNENQNEEETELTDENSSVLSLDMDKSVYDGEAFYVEKDGEFYKFTFKNETELVKDIWITKDTLNSDKILKGQLINSYTECLANLQLAGDYIYFVYDPGDGYSLTQKKEIYRLGRINKEGTSVEFIGDAIASRYTVSDGWIYYYDNGYVYDDRQESDYYIDDDRAGIYKIRIDGGEKEKLLDDMGEKEFEEYSYEVCEKLEVHENYLYFLDCSNNGKSRVCRMKTDGTDLEYVSDEGACCYTIDTDDEMYYISGNYCFGLEESSPAYKVDLNEMKEKYFYEFKSGHVYYPEIDYYDGYLYFSEKYHNFRIGKTAGMRYDFNTDTNEEIHGDYEIETVKNGIAYKKISHGPYLNWETVED